MAPRGLAATVRALIARAGRPAIEADLALASLSTASQHSYTTAWRSYELHCTSRSPPINPLAFDRDTILQHAISICSSAHSGRPYESIKQLKTVCRFVARITQPLAQPVPDDLVRLLRGLVRKHTTSDATYADPIDVPRLLAFIEANAHAALSDLQLARRLGLLGFTALLPSRPSDCAQLTFTDVTLVLPALTATAPERRIQFHQLAVTPAATRTDTLSHALLAGTVPFDLVIVVRKSKGDTLRIGKPKRLQHPPTEDGRVSPALALVRLLHQLIVASPATPITAATPCFGRLVYDTARSPPSPLLCIAPYSRDTISHHISDAVLAATGSRPQARQMRSASASYLAAQGIPLSIIAAQGGWSETGTIIRHYTRVASMDGATAARLAFPNPPPPPLLPPLPPDPAAAAAPAPPPTVTMPRPLPRAVALAALMAATQPNAPPQP